MKKKSIDLPLPEVLGPEEYKLIGKYLTEHRFLIATFVSDYPRASDEWELFKHKVAVMGKLRDLCEQEAMKCKS